MVVPTLDAEEFQYRDDGVLLNGSNIVPFIDIVKIAGLDAVELDQSEHTREQVDGGYIDALYEKMRAIILDGNLYANTFQMESYLDQLKANFAPSATPQPFYIGTDAGVRVAYGKSLGFKYDKETLRRTGRATCQITIMCEDPRLYSPTIVSSEITLASTIITGRSYDKAFAYGYGTTSSSNALTLELGGNRQLPGTIRVYGPITNPVIYNAESDTYMSFNLTIEDGDYVEINLNNRTVKLNGITGKRGDMTLSGNWYLLRPGTNSFTLTGSATLSGTTKLVVTANAAAWR